MTRIDRFLDSALDYLLILATLAFLSVAVVASTGCSASQRERTIKTTLAAVNETRVAFVVFDRAAQAAIVATATSYEQGATALAAYRAKREIVVDAFSFAYRSIATAATINDEPTLANMISAAAGIAEAFRDFKERTER